MKVKTITTCALFAALMCILGPLSIPIGPVPISLTGLVIYSAVMILGTKPAAISYIIYLLLGIAGLPVFSGFQGGIAKLAGPTGGYLVGNLLMILVCGFIMEKSNRNVIITLLGMILGTAVNYFFGTAWFVILMECDIPYALGLCVWPFIPFDLVKMLIAVFLGKGIRSTLIKAGVLETSQAAA